MSEVKDFVENKSVHEGQGGKINVATNSFDFSDTGAAEGDVVQLIKVPKGAIVKEVILDITTAETESGGALGNLGDGDDADGYISDIPADTTSIISTRGLSTAFKLGKKYSDYDTIDLTTAAALDTAAGNIVVEYLYPTK